MANMSYCRFQNTFNDLRDCNEYILDNFSDISEEEYIHRVKLIALCKTIIDEYNEFIPDEEEIEYLISISLKEHMKYVLKKALLNFSYDALMVIKDYAIIYYPNNLVFQEKLIETVSNKFPEMIEE